MLFRYTSAAASLLASVAIAAPAAAQDRSSWSGIYVGGQIGYGNVDSDRATVLFDNNLDGTFGDTIRTGAGADAFSPGFCGGEALSARAASGCDTVESGIEGGVHAGADFDLGGLVVGVVGEYDRHDQEDNVTAFSTTPASYTLTRKLRSSYGLRARAGVPLFSQTLAYATAGVVRGSFRQSFSTSNTANGFAVADRSTNGWGYRLGAGVEQRLTDNVSFGLLYLYSSIKDEDGGRINVTRGTAPATNPFVLVNANGSRFQRSDDRFESHAARLTASLRF